MTSISTKKAFLTSLISLLTCITMLIGSTFAWFTDTSTTGVNQILAGTLDIELVDENGESLEGETLTFVDKDGNSDILWEPGCTFHTNGFSVVQKGNLQFKYKVVITGLNGDSKLLDVIDFSVVYADDLNEALEEDVVSNDFEATWQFSYDSDGKFVATQTTPYQSDLMYVVAKMDKAAGNEYQGLTLEGIGITVIATQDNVENDSFDNQYDEDADYPYVSVNGVDYLTIEEAIAAAKAGDTVTLKGDITTEKQIVIDKDLTLDLNTYTIFGTEDVNDNAVLRICSPDADTEINVTINATLGGIKTTGTNIMPIYAGHVNMGKTNVTINGGDYESNCKWAVYQNNGTCTINGGSFRADGQSDTANGQPVYNSAVLDSYDYDELTGKFVINGGKFYQFNPACLSVNAGDHHDHDSIAEGKTGILDKDGWFVVAEGELNYHIICNCEHPASAHEHCYATLEDAEAALAANNCEWDVIVEGVAPSEKN